MISTFGLPTNGLPDQGWKLYLTSLIMIIAAGLAASARLTTRIIYGRLGPDDYTIIASLVFSIFLSVSVQLAISNGYGMHKKDLEQHELQTALEWLFIAQIAFKVVVMFNKISVVLLYKRLFVNNSFQRVCWVFIAFIAAWSAAAIFATIFQCLPIEKSFERHAVNGHCIKRHREWIAYATINVITDAIVLILPIRGIARLQFTTWEKLMVYGVFLMGGSVMICSILRATAVGRSAGALRDHDLTWNFIPRGIFTLIEANVGIVCPCLPVLRQPVHRLVNRFVKSRCKSRKSETAIPLNYNNGQHVELAESWDRAYRERTERSTAVTVAPGWDGRDDELDDMTTSLGILPPCASEGSIVKLPGVMVVERAYNGS
ncbi:Hypothetical protein R9X50_00509600 [Acrodontium crateriforme]|uniref:Rhodopsin domain-containing protein n=1 Tax=Acrodontium crateriforme TaxID=150365 RepID=A0AAQ3M7C1_9PEZI|nr:Hypothetical protein R9X50_00509600 [Acrodontium crateriforme]